VPSLFPKHVRYPFADRHVAFWDHVWSVQLGRPARAFIGIWPRDGGKSTSAELATAALGLRGVRKYALYVRMTQVQADKSVANIAALLESKAVERHYPAHADREVNKYGNSKGWRRERLRTAGGFTVDAVGLDTAVRGLKVEEQRPDLIIFDDIDEQDDSAATTAHKINVLTKSVLPAGSDDLCVIGIQNLIIADGVFSRLEDGRADFLTDRVMSGPHPAIRGLEWEWQEDPETGTRVPIITSGEPTWLGQDVAKCQKLMQTIGPSAFEKECQHEVRDISDALALRFDAERHFADLTHEQCKALVALGRVFGGIDFGEWRFAFTLWTVDRAGIPHRIDEVFSQREGHNVRAQKIHDTCAKYGISALIPIWGDAANPSDIRHLNLEFKRIGSPLRVVAVHAEGKSRQSSVNRINDFLDRTAIKFRRQIMDVTSNKPPIWRAGWKTTSAGVEMTGSRLIWEMGQWSYPIVKEGEAQEQDPEDDTADGGDMVASMRYALMSWFRPAEQATAKPEKTEDKARPYDYAKRQLVPAPRFDDEMTGPSNRRFTRSIRTPRPRVGR
jgi:hypothetical protein